MLNNKKFPVGELSYWRDVLLATCSVGAPSYSHTRVPVTTQIGRRVEMATYLTAWLMLTLICPANSFHRHGRMVLSSTSDGISQRFMVFPCTNTTYSYILRILHAHQDAFGLDV